MPRAVKVRLNSGNLRKFLNSAPVSRDLQARAERVRAALPTDRGEQWEVQMLRGDRVSFVVRPANAAARQRAAEEPVMQRALGAGRG